jgi:DNA helicase IV
MKHPEVASEQRYIDNAYRHAERMRDRAAELAEGEDLAAGEFDAAVLRTHFLDRARSLTESLSASLCFGRIDDPDDRFYVGRSQVEDEEGATLVLDWRARAAVPFYRATLANPMGLSRRRRFILEGRTLQDILEEDFENPQLSSTLSGGVPDPLLAELGRSRTGRMRDIVTTVQAEQDEVIRAPLSECLIVQGGPGTGKTAVGLHRAAYLLYEHHDRLLREGVLVLGPNRLFLDYVSRVLPALGEHSVTQATIVSLLGRYRVDRADSAEAAAVKGDLRMADVIRNVARQMIASAHGDTIIPYRTAFIRIEAAAIQALLWSTADGTEPWSVRRNHFRAQFIRLARDRLRPDLRARADIDDLTSVVLSGPTGRQLDRWWRPLTARSLVTRVLTNVKALARASEGLLSPTEQAAIRRRPAKRGQGEGWTPHDLPLLDEAEAFLNGIARRVGHIIVDEVQDRTPMELRLIGRRSASGSMTLLGDLAQATAVGAPPSWEAVARDLGVPVTPRIVELTIGYRLPAAILDFANRLLPIAAPRVRPTRSGREVGQPPSVVRCASSGAVVDEAAELGAAFSRRYATAAIIGPDRMVAGLHDLLLARDVPHATAGSATLETLTVLTPVSAKGLEFDAVVVMEPQAIVAAEPGGYRALFVALTRAVQHLTLLHADDLPDVLQ